MKILFLSHKFYPDVGGIEVNSEILANNFVKFGAEVHLVTWSADPQNKIFSFDVIRNPNVLTLIREHNWADIVFENNPCLMLSWPLLLFRKPHVIAIRTWITRVDGSLAHQDKLKLNWLSRANAIIAVSEKIREVTFDKAIVIGNPFRDKLFKVVQTIKKDKDFVFLGRLVSDKGVDMCIELLHLLHDSNSNYGDLTLTIIGDGPEKVKLEQLVKSYELGCFVTFTGVLRGLELTNCLNEHKYLLAPSRWIEPYGNVALEGMACGCLPIVSNGGGLVDAIGNAGVAFERNNGLSLLDNVKNLLIDKDFEKELRGNSAEHLKKHNPEFVSKKYFDVLVNSLT